MLKIGAQNKVAKGHFIVKNDRGLHTRPCTEIVKCTTRFKSSIHLRHQKCHVNAKSILGILMLAAARGAKIHIEAEGEEEDLEAILRWCYAGPDIAKVFKAESETSEEIVGYPDFSIKFDP